MQQPAPLALSQGDAEQQAACLAGAGTRPRQPQGLGPRCISSCRDSAGDGCPRKPCHRAAWTRSRPLEQHFWVQLYDCETQGQQRMAPASLSVPGASPHRTAVTRRIAKGSSPSPLPPATSSRSRVRGKAALAENTFLLPSPCQQFLPPPPPSLRVPTLPRAAPGSAHPQISPPHTVGLAGHRQKQIMGENIAKVTLPATAQPPSLPPTHALLPPKQRPHLGPSSSAFSKDGKLL